MTSSRPDRRPVAPDARAAGTAVPPGLDARTRATLWETVPAAFATELGALATIAGGAVVGIVVGIVAVVALTGLLRRIAPGPAVLRSAFLVGGPPLRYGSVVVAAWYEWTIRGAGPASAIAVALVLVLFVPLVGTVLAAIEARARRS